MFKDRFGMHYQWGKGLLRKTKLRQGNVFTGVCESVHGGSLSQYAPQVT